MKAHLGFDVAWWVAFFMPLIKLTALPLRRISDDDFQDGVAQGILMVVEAVTGQGKFDPAKGNIVDYMSRALQGIRMQARKEAEAGTVSMDALIEANDGDDDTLLSLADYEGDDYAKVDIEHEMFDLLNEWRANTVMLMAEPSPDEIAGGDMQNDRWLFTVPQAKAEDVLKYTSAQVVYKPWRKGHKPVVAEMEHVVARVDGSGASYYPDDDHEYSPAEAFYARIGELDDTEGLQDLPQDAVCGQEFEDGDWLDGLDDEDEPEVDEVEIEENAEALDMTAPYFWQLQRQMREFKLAAEGVRHIAWLEYKKPSPVVVRSVKAGKGLVATNGAILSLRVAAGIAGVVKPASGNQAAMVKAVKAAFPNDPNAALFAQRVEALALLQ